MEGGDGDGVCVGGLGMMVEVIKGRVVEWCFGGMLRGCGTFLVGGYYDVDDCGFSTLFNGEYVCFHGI